MTKLAKFFVILLLVIFWAVALSPLVLADECKPGELCNPLGTEDFGVIVGRVTEFIKNVAIYGIAPLMVVIGGFYIMTAGGTSERVTQGRKMIMWALIGVIILILAQSLTNLIVEIITGTDPNSVGPPAPS